jgi:FkbM family methyltransferase
MMDRARSTAIISGDESSNAPRSPRGEGEHVMGMMRTWLRAKLARRLRVPEIPIALERIAARGFSPSLIFDVGAYRGDFASTCLANWPDARVGCFEVLPRRVEQLRKLAATKGGALRVHPFLLGAEEAAEVTLYEAETASSVLKEQARPQHRSNVYQMTTVDAVVSRQYQGQSPDLLKLDVQGFELEVLKGAEASLPAIQVILAETNLLDLHHGVPLLAELVAWLHGHSFMAYDICGLTRRPLDDALWQADLMFVQADSRFRRDKRWNVP